MKKPSMSDQLYSISKTLGNMILYEFQTTDDMTDAIELSKIKDLVDYTIRERQA